MESVSPRREGEAMVGMGGHRMLAVWREMRDTLILGRSPAV